MRKPLPDISVIHRTFTYSEAHRGLVYLPRNESTFPSRNAYSIWMSKWCGKKAGTRLSFRRKNKPRYTAIRVGHDLYYEHLLVLAWHGTQVPEHKEVDHMDNDPTNNSISNLRLVDPSLNRQRQVRRGKAARLMGVRKHQGKWMARASIDGKRHFVGYFTTRREALTKRIEFIENARGEKLDPVLLLPPDAWEPCHKPG